VRILADENIEPFLVTWLRTAGHAVLSVRETNRGSGDSEVLRLALDTKRVLLTADKDFGELVFRQRRSAAGVILLRLHTASRREFIDLVQQHFPAIANAAPNHFVTVTNGALRVRRLLSGEV